MKFCSITVFLCSIVCILNIDAQITKHRSAKVDKTKVSICTGGILNSKAIHLPAPIYPLDARKTIAANSISVRVEVDEQGSVTKAEGCSGHLSLRSVAEAAALQARIKQTKLGGIAVKVSGLLNYNFDPVRSYSEPVVLSCQPTMNIIKYINAYAINLVLPDYPKELEGNIRSSVVVQVTVDENGKVSGARAVSGHQAFRQNAMDAAKRSTFRRFTRCGKPVTLTSFLGYNVAPPK